MKSKYNHEINHGQTKTSNVIRTHYLCLPKILENLQFLVSTFGYLKNYFLCMFNTNIRFPIFRIFLYNLQES